MRVCLCKYFIQLNNTPSHHNDGSLDFEEFAAFMRPTLSDPHRLTKKQQELREAFDAFDKDGDGVINATELQAMMEKLGDKLSLSESQDLISDVDLDKDGAVNFEEFAVMMGISLPTSKVARSVERKECHHKHHWFSVRRYFCSEK